MTTTDEVKPQPLTDIEVAAPEPYDKQFWSVTTILDVLASPALEYWAIRETATAAVDSPGTIEVLLKEQGRDETIKFLCGARWRKPKIALGSAQLGTVVHALCESAALSGSFPTDEEIYTMVRTHAAKTVDLPSEVALVKQMLGHFMRWCERFQPRYLAAEAAVYNETYGYAGCLDAVLEIGGVPLIADYKGLDVTTQIPTPDGWSTMGSVQIGDRVFGTDGRPVTVTAKSEVHLNHCYRVTFDDTSSIVCDDEHLWAVISSYERNNLKRERTIIGRTDELRLRVRRGGNKQRDLLIPVAQPLELPASDLPVDPYVYGCWLGDGEKNGGAICKPDEELFDLIRARGYRVGNPMGAPAPGRCRSRTVYGLSRKLKDAGLFGHRIIPDVYLRSSISQRLDLLRGMMDTDGCWNTQRNQAVFVSMSKATAEQVYELVTSLGERALCFSYKGSGFGKNFTAYKVVWSPQINNPFSLSRKANKVIMRAGKRSWRRLITSIEPTLTVPTQCITVDSIDGCYLAGRQMVPTHNTRREPLTSRGGPQRPYGETALQLAAYRHAEILATWRARRTEIYKRRYYLLGDDERVVAEPVPTVDSGLCIIITPESCEAYPMRCDEEVFQHFLYVLESFRWNDDLSKRVVGDALEEM